MHAFIVRPFGVKNGIDFDRVEAELIRPACEQLGLSGGTTAEFIEQGNIRTDMFEQLLISDLVIADISIHNANAFYELGIRHALRDSHTFLIRSRADEVPFDLKTDRYLTYDAEQPNQTLDQLVAALKATLDSQKADSPVYQLLPGLKPSDAKNYVVVPTDFREEVERANAAGSIGDLQRLAAEVDGFAWRSQGLRLIGKAQFDLRNWQGTKHSWEAVRQYDPVDLEANTFLSTILQRMDDLVGSDQALERALSNADLSSSDRAELLALQGSNAKRRWLGDWEQLEDPDAMQIAALGSPHLTDMFERYNEGFLQDRNHYYSGINALAAVTFMVELAENHPEDWEDGFDSEREANTALDNCKTSRHDLAIGVKLAIESRRNGLLDKGEQDLWVDITAADCVGLTATKPARVARAYKKALARASRRECATARRQIGIYQRLGVLLENAKAALDVIPDVEAEEETQSTKPHVILFTGHRIDTPGRKQPRFPADGERRAREMIMDTVIQEKEKAAGDLVACAGGASGGDILFLEICRELGIPTRMFLALPKPDYIKASVADSGPGWVERFNELYRSHEPAVLADSRELPLWLRKKQGYSIWQRCNLWMLYDALDMSAGDLTLIALWNGSAGDGPGGTEDMVKQAREHGAKFIHLDARELVG